MNRERTPGQEMAHFTKRTFMGMDFETTDRLVRGESIIIIVKSSY